MSINKLNLNLSILDEEYEALSKELIELDNLYKDSKEILDNNKGTRGNAYFITGQTSNLISIKEKKLSILKELVGIKEKKLEMQVKEFTANKNIDDNTNNNTEKLKELFTMLVDNRSMIVKNIEPDNDTKNEEDIDIDSILEQRLNDNIVEKEKNGKQKNTIDFKSLLEKEHLKIAVDEERNIYIIDEDYNIINDKTYDPYIESIIIERYEDDSSYAYDTEGNKYEVVEFMNV